jgi:hypothetical protein
MSAAAQLGWMVLLLAAVAGTALLVLRARRGRAAGRGLPPLPERPYDVAADGCTDIVPPVPGVYVSTRTGDRPDHLAPRDLGVRGRATVHVTPAGVSFDRSGAADLFVPAAWVRGVRRETGPETGRETGRGKGPGKGRAARSAGEGGLVVVTWEHGDRLLDTGFRPDRARTANRLEAAISGLVTEGSAS